MLPRPRAALALGITFALFLPALSQAAPVVVVDVSSNTIQRLVDGMLAVGEIRAGLKDDDLLAVKITDSAADSYIGRFLRGEAHMSLNYLKDRATHTISMNGASAVTLANAYDSANTAKLLLKGGYVGLESRRQSVQLAFNALVKTSADERLKSYVPKVGDSITHGGCTGTLAAGATEGYFQVRLCDADYVVNQLGGVNGKIPNSKLTDYCRNLNTKYQYCRLAIGVKTLSGGDQESIRGTCRAALGERPTGSGLEPGFWDYKFSQCVRSNYMGGKE